MHTTLLTTKFIFHHPGTMSLRGNHNGTRLKNDGTSEGDKHVNRDLSTTVEPGVENPFAQFTPLPLILLCLGMLLSWLRTSGILVFGYSIKLLWGTIPIECIVLSMSLFDYWRRGSWREYFVSDV